MITPQPLGGYFHDYAHGYQVNSWFGELRIFFRASSLLYAQSAARATIVQVRFDLLPQPNDPSRQRLASLLDPAVSPCSVFGQLSAAGHGPECYGFDDQYESVKYKDQVFRRQNAPGLRLKRPTLMLLLLYQNSKALRPLHRAHSEIGHRDERYLREQYVTTVAGVDSEIGDFQRSFAIDGLRIDVH